VYQFGAGFAGVGALKYTRNNMNKLASSIVPSVVLTVITICLIAGLFFMGLSGCGPNSADQGSSSEEDGCPDASVVVNEASLSLAIDENGKPVNQTNVFTKDTPEIFCTFYVPDLCCTTLHIKWFQGDTAFSEWVGSAPGLLVPLNISVSKPPEGFVVGSYRVVLYIGIYEEISVSFRVE
jgi:hypothetical protein